MKNGEFSHQAAKKINDYDRNRKSHGFLRLDAAGPCLNTWNICLNRWQKKIRFHMMRISYLACM